MLRTWFQLTRGDADALVVQLAAAISSAMVPIMILAGDGVPMQFLLGRAVPGFALGFLIANVWFGVMAVRLGRSENRTNATAMPYGVNIPAAVALVTGIFLPVYAQTDDPVQAWAMTAAGVVWMALFKLLAAPLAGYIQRIIPPSVQMMVMAAAMYGYLGLLLLPRIFDSPAVGMLALGIVLIGIFAGIPFTRWRLPPVLVAWIVPLALALVIGYVKPAWGGLAWTPPVSLSILPIKNFVAAAAYLPVILPMALYQVVQSLAAAAGATNGGDAYSPTELLLADGTATLITGLCGSIIVPALYASHPAYRKRQAGSGYAFWTGIIIFGLIVTGLFESVITLFPWSIIAALIAYVAILVGESSSKAIDRKYHLPMLLGFILPSGAVLMNVVSSVIGAVGADPTAEATQTSLDQAIYWSSIQGLGHGFVVLVMFVGCVTVFLVDRKFLQAVSWCLIGAAAAWTGLLHAPTLGWGVGASASYALGWVSFAVMIWLVSLTPEGGDMQTSHSDK